MEVAVTPGVGTVIIDSHAHLWQRERNPQPWIDPATMPAIARDFWIDDLAAQQEAAGIAGAIVVQAVNSRGETRDLLAVADGRSIRGVVGWIDLEGDIATQLAALADAPGGERLVGIRHLVHLDDDPRWLERATVAAGLDVLATARLPFDLVIRADQLEQADAAAARHPDLTFILDHIAKPPLSGGDLRGWTRGLRSIAARPNVVAKLSGLSVEADWSTWTSADLGEAVAVAVDAFGPDRLLFGSDWPLADLAGGTTRWLDAALGLLGQFSEPELAAFLAGNTLSTYGLEADTHA